MRASGLSLGLSASLTGSVRLRRRLVSSSPDPVIPSGRHGIDGLRALFFPGKQSALAQHLFAEFALQAVAQKEAGIRGVADAKACDRLFVQSATQQIFARSGTLGTPQAFLEKCRGALVDVEQLGAQLGFFRFRRTGVSRLGQRDAELLRHQPDSFGEGDVFDFLDEAEDVSRDAAAEAVKELARGMHRKRRRLFAVKRTKSGIVLRPGFFQLDVVADDADDIRLLLDRFFEIFCGHGCI